MSYIEIFDDKIYDVDWYYDYVKDLNYTYGEQDNKDTPPTGMVAELSTEKDVIYHKLSELYHDLCPVSDQYNQIDRAYVNAFAPRELPYYHTDGDCITLLYYANPMWFPDWGGETKIIKYDREVFAIAPVPGRIVIFNGSLRHTATSFRNTHRFTVALKFKSENN